MELATVRVAALIALSAVAAAQTPVVNNVVSQATSGAPVSPGMPVLVIGNNLSGSGTLDCPGPKVPLICGSVSVTVGNRAVPVRTVFPTQVVTYIPTDQAAGTTTLVLKNHLGVSSAPFSVTVAQFAPGIQKLTDPSNTIPFGVFTDTSQRAINRGNPVAPGQEVTMYALGLGPTVPAVPAGEVATAPLTTLPVVIIGNRPIPVVSAGLGCGFLCEPGNYLVRFRLPEDLASGDQPISVEAGGRRSDAVLLVVGAPPSGPVVGYLQSYLDARVRAMSPGVMANVVGGGFTDNPTGVSPCLSTPGVMPTRCQGLTVTVNGRPAAIQTVATNFVSIQIPFELSPGPATLVVERGIDTQTLRSSPHNFTLDAFSPTLAYDPHVNYATVVVESTGGPALATNPLLSGDQVWIYCTGLGQTNPPLVTGFSLIQPARTVVTPIVMIGGRPLENVIAEVLPGMIGQYRVSGRVPTGLPAGDLPIVMEIGGKKSQDGLLVPVASGPVIAAVVNGASGEKDIVSGSWVSIYGRALSPGTRQWAEDDFVNDWMPTTLDGVEVAINNVAAVIAFISPTQLNVLAPDNLPAGNVEVTVKSSLGWQKSAASVKAHAPGLFNLPGPMFPLYVLATHTDYSYVARPEQFPPTVAARPAQPAETIVLYGTGFGPTNPEVSSYHRFDGAAPLSSPLPVRVLIGSFPAEVTFAGMIGNGLYQVNVVVPALPDGDHEVIVSMGAEASARGRLLPVRR